MHWPITIASLSAGEGKWGGKDFTVKHAIDSCPCPPRLSALRRNFLYITLVYRHGNRTPLCKGVKKKKKKKLVSCANIPILEKEK